MNPIAKMLLFIGLLFIVAGVIWQFFGKQIPLGRLPGDIVIERENFHFYFPITTSILISLLLSLLFYLWNRFFG